MAAARRMLVAALVLAVAACSGGDETATTGSDLQAVGFGAYVNRTTTRGGATGTLDLDALKTEGFGVFAYYTNGHHYNQLSLPDFMYNQQVTYDTDQWTYSPVKYWPNETGADAVSADTDYLTFFAYAPYADVDAVSGCVLASPTTGVTALTRAKDSGDPLVSYHASFDPAGRVDLCWATPVLNMTKPSVAQTVDFNFRHALASLNVQIDADVNVSAHPSEDLDGDTRIWVRSVTFEGFAVKGQLSLNNSTESPHWYGPDCECDLTSRPVTIYDGRRDRHEGVSASLNEQPTGLNDIIVQSAAYGDGSLTAGVTASTVNLFGNALTAQSDPIYVLPTGDAMRVTIEYDVETSDAKLISNYLADGKTHGSSIENNITATVTSGGDPITLEAGKQYTIHIHLGMTSVKMDAEVSPWPASAEDTITLPKNN